MSEAVIETKIVCPACGGNCKAVKDSRPHEIYGNPTIKRRRRCENCGEKVTTFEISEASIFGVRREIAKEMVVHLLSEMTK